MRRVRLGMNVSLDGYVSRPNGELDWLFRTMAPEQMQAVTEILRQGDTILIGRVNYLEQAAHWPQQSGELADLLNSHTKIVFSKTLDTLVWNNSRLATADPATEIARLKQQPGKDIFVPGGASFVQSLSRLGLIDEYNITIHPIVLGSGKPLFKDLAESLQLRLVSSHAFDTGAVNLVYRPAGQSEQ